MQAKSELLNVLRRDPRQFGYDQSRWTIETIGDCLEWLKEKTPSGISKLLERLGISYKRGRDYVHSPDANYERKLTVIELARLRAKYDPQHYVCLYLDELSYYRQPTLSCDWECLGQEQPLARRSYKSNTCFRVIAALNALTGQVTFEQRSHIDVRTIANFYRSLCAVYPDAREIAIVHDNWPVHFHPDVLVGLQPQVFPFPPKVPPNWPSAPNPKLPASDLPIRLLCLPTYASWLNPIEKLWRWLKQQVLHLHRQSDDWFGLKQRVAEFLQQFLHGSHELLHYVGLLPN